MQASKEVSLAQENIYTLAATVGTVLSGMVAGHDAMSTVTSRELFGRLQQQFLGIDPVNVGLCNTFASVWCSYADGQYSH